MDREKIPSSPLEFLVSAWEGRLKRATEYKYKNFDIFAEEAVDFYVGPKDIEEFYSKRMLSRKNGNDTMGMQSGFKTVSAKVAELVQLFGPALYARNPVRTVNPRESTPMDRAIFVPPSLERQVQQQVQQIQQQAQQYMQQLQAQVPPQQPGMPPDPQLQQLQAIVQQQVQAQIQQVQAPLVQAQEMYQQIVDAQAEQQLKRRLKSVLLSDYLNYTPHELDLKTESRLAINEALIKGMSCIWSEIKEIGNVSVVGSFFDTVDNLLLDPDVERLGDLRWISRRCVKTVDEIAERYEISADKLRPYAKLHTYSAQADEDSKKSDDEAEDIPKDLLTYYEIYSKVGFGSKISGLDDDQQEAIDGLGKYVYLALVPGMPELLNLRGVDLETLVSEEEVEKGEEEVDGMDLGGISAKDEILMRTSWPIPFWLDGAWPVEMLWFHEIPNCVWPMSHVRPAMPQLKAITWNMNHLANRARNTSRLMVGLPKGADDDVKAVIRGGDPISLLELEQSQGQKIGDMMSVLDIPQGGATELMRVQASLIDEFQKSTGLSEVMYAQPGGMRSAAEAQMKQSSMNIRPDDMSAQVEDWQSRIASKEAMAAIWLLTGEDVAPIIGQTQAQLWDQHLASESPEVVAMELDVRIEAGSTRKPNKETRVQQMTQAVQTMGPILSQLAMGGGIIGPWNALMKEWGKANDIPDIDGFLLPPPQPPQPPPPDPNIQAKAQADVQAKQQETQMKMALGQQQMQADQQKAQTEAVKAQMELAAKAQELQLKQQEMQMNLQAKQAEVQLDLAKAQKDMQASDMQHQQAMIAAAQKNQLERQIAESKAEAQLDIQKEKEKQNAASKVRRQKRRQGRQR